MWVVLIVLLFICVVVLLQKLLSVKKQLEISSGIAGKVTDADAYALGIRAEADTYAVGKKVEADTYALGIRAEADAYALEKKVEADELYSITKENEVGLKKEVAALTHQKAELKSELNILALDVVSGMVRIDAYENLKSDEVKNALTMLRGQQDDLVRTGAALTITNESASKKVINSQVKQILRCFNAECTNTISDVTVKNIDTSRAKIQRSFDAINKIFDVDGVQISQAFLASKFDELSLVYSYMIKEDEEREQRKAIKEQMVEEEKVRREIEREKDKIAKEESQFSNEVQKLIGYMQKTNDTAERQLYIDKIGELEEKLKALSADKENVLEREQNTRAGFVYIISNIGSFGENIYKIGMTRRLEPMDRISELSSASVPFTFDVHAMIFSADAPGLEATLHQTFRKYQVNKVNPRKEFFRIDLESVKKIVTENHNATVRFIESPEATEYRETLRIEAEKSKSD